MFRLSRLTAAALIGAASVFALPVSNALADASTITVVDGIDVKDWDTSLAYGHESYVMNNIYDGLMRYNSAEGKLEPALATEWKVSDDGLKWTFTIRQGVKFHGGEDVNAPAIANALQHYIKGGQGPHYLWGGATVEAADDWTLTITTKDPLPIDLIASGSYACMIASPSLIAKGSEAIQKGLADGTGPYKLVQWVPNQQVVLERNKDYWGGWTGGEADRVIVRMVTEISTQLQMLRSGEADLLFSTIPFDMVETLKQDPNIKVYVGPSWQYLYGPINVKKAPTDNLKFRQAIQHLIDYDTIAKQIYAGLATVPTGAVPEAMPGFKPLKIPPFDIEKAKQLVEESGVPPDQRKITWVAYGGVDVLKNVALLFQANAKKAGIEVEIVQGDWGVMWDKQKKFETSANVYPFRNWPDYGTIQPSPILKTQENMTFNFSYYSDPEVDAWIDEGTKNEAVDKVKTSDVWNKAYQKAMDDGAYVNIANVARVIPYSAKLEGVVSDAAYETVFFRFLKKKE
ncbi:MAG: ABC transporter substrate-binding protein [Hyphomicrobiaceae bacterium]